MCDVACLGILCVDVLGKPIDRLPERGKLELVETIQLSAGGCAANLSIDLSRIGIKTAIIGKIGNDGYGRFISEVLQSETIDVSGLKVDSNVQTSASMVMIDSSGERSILHCLGSNAEFTYEDIDFEIVRNSRILFIAGTFLMPGFDGPGAEKLLMEAREAGLLCCMDTAWDSSGMWMSKIRGMLRYLDWFMPSYDEARMLTGMYEPEEIAEALLTEGVRNVVVKLGKAGCYVKSQNQKGIMVPSMSSIRAVDTSGAGDSFCAGFTAGLTRGWEIEKCARFANAVGALCVMQMGTTAGIRSMDETLEFMEYGRISAH